MPQECQPLEVESASVYWIGDGVQIVVRGELVSTCWTPELDASLIDVWPPEFTATRCATGTVCLPVVTPYVHARTFLLGDRPDTVVLHTASVSPMTLDVEDIPTLAQSYEQVEDVAVGMSSSFSFDEAFADALTRLPRRDLPFPDAEAVIEIENIKARIGGVAGWHHLFVTVRRTVPG